MRRSLSRATGIVASLLLAAGQASPRAPETFEPGWEVAWQERQLAGERAIFSVVAEDGDPVLRAVSVGAATALYREVEREAGDSQVLSWRWKVETDLSGAPDERTRAGDDFAARVFVVFGSNLFERGSRALCYVWSAKIGEGSTFRSPYSDDVATIVLRSGQARVGEWREERRDVVADFRAAFGRDPEPIRALAVMTDTDNTGSRATAWYDDLVFW